MVHVTLKEIETAYRRHKHVVDTCISPINNTHLMVLFYAVECGLKALYMRKHGIKRTNQQNNSCESVHAYQHNLNALRTQLKINLEAPKAKAKDGSQIESHDLHQAWRYGKTLVKQEELTCAKSLKKLLNELDLKFSQGGKVW